MEATRRDVLGLMAGAAALAVAPPVALATPVPSLPAAGALAGLTRQFVFRVNGGPWMPVTEVIPEHRYAGVYSCSMKINAKRLGFDPFDIYAKDDNHVEVGLMAWEDEPIWISEPMWLHGLETHCGATADVDFTLHMSVI